MKELCDYMKSLSSPFIVLVDDFKQWYAKEFNDFWEWVEYAVKCMIEYNKEDGIE